MLQKLSDGAKGGISKFILVGFLFMAVMGLVLTDVGGFFRDGVSSTSVAEVGSEPIPYHEFDRFLRSALANQQMTVQDAYQTGQVHNILNRYAQDILFVQAAENLGIRTPDEAVASELHRFVEPYITPETTAQQALTRMLVQQGISEENFVDAIRRDLTSNILQQAILSGVETAPPLLSQELMRYQNETRDITYLPLPHSRIQIENLPTEDEMKEFYAASKIEFRIPQRRGFTVAILDPKTLVSEVDEPAEEEIRAYYDDHMDRYEIPSGRKVEQAIFATEDDARKALEEIQAGTAFKEITGDKYRGDNVYQEESVPDTLKDVIFSEENTPVRGPVKSPLGWHIINDLGLVESSYRPYEEVKGTIVLVLKKQIERDALMDAIDTINDRIDDGDALDAVATDFKMESLTLDPIDQFGLNAKNEDGLKSFENEKGDMIDTLFTLYEGEISETMELSDGRLALLKVDQVVPESVKPFEEVKDAIKDRLIANRQLDQNRIAAQDYFRKLQSGEITLQKISTDTKQDIQLAKNVKRILDDPNAEKKVSANLRARMFVTDPGKYALIHNPDGFVIAKSSEPRMVKTAKATEEAENMARQMTIVLTLSTYYNYLTEQTPIRVNQRLLDQLYGQPQS